MYQIVPCDLHGSRPFPLLKICPGISHPFMFASVQEYCSHQLYKLIGKSSVWHWHIVLPSLPACFNTPAQLHMRTVRNILKIWQQLSAKCTITVLLPHVF